MDLQCHIDASLDRLSDRSWRRRPGRHRIKWSDQLRDTQPPTTHSEIYGGVLFAVVTVAEQRNGRRQLYTTPTMMMTTMMLGMWQQTRSDVRSHCMWKAILKRCSKTKLFC